MNNDSRGPINKNIHTNLNDFLDFGPETVVLKSSTQSDSEIEARIRVLVVKLQEINERLARLSQLI